MKRIKPSLVFGLCLLALLVSARPAWAHKPSDSFLRIKATDRAIQGEWDIALRDFEFNVGLDDNSDGKISWGELKAHESELVSYALGRLKTRSFGEDCTNHFERMLVSRHSDGGYATLQFTIECLVAPLDDLAIDYGLFFEFDAQHRGLLNLRFHDSERSAVLTKANPHYLASRFDDNAGGLFRSYVVEGIWHILEGYDHMLFLIALLFPAAFVRREGRWIARGNLKDTLLDTVKVVTAFTLSHTISLCLTTFHIITPPPSRLVESLIAASIVVTAVNNIVPLFRERRWLIGFVFGLVHGIGFASVLTDLGLSLHAIAVALVGFNIGVELGQIAIVALFIPLSFAFRESLAYRRYVLVGGSAVTALLALGWMVERIGDLHFMPF